VRLSTRLLLLILGCLLPILGAQVYNQVHLNAQRRDQIAALALQRAELVNSDTASVIEGASGIAAAVAASPDINPADSTCDDRLAAMRHDIAMLKFLAITDREGRVVCASEPGLRAQAGGDGAWIKAVPAAGVGVVSSAPGIDGPFLPVYRAIPAAGEHSGQGAHAGGYAVAALDLRWFDEHLEQSRLLHSQAESTNAVILADRNGIIAGRYPDGDHWIGRPVPDSLRTVATSATTGVTTIPWPDGDTRMAAYVPSSRPPIGISAIEAVSITGMTTDLQHASAWELSVIGVAALAAMLLAWLAGRRFIYQPTEILLRAVQRWRDGDMSARAVPAEAGSEFAALAHSFNSMAASLEAREVERRLQAEVLEMRVAARTRELSESNNRLQVEIAERERTETALHQAQKLQAVGQLAGGIAHDFNNMLATVLGNLELMERRVTQSTEGWSATHAERLTRLIERAIGAVQRGSQLTSRLMAFSRRQRLAARSTDLNVLVTDLVSLATSTLGRRVQVKSDLAEDLWPAMVDPSQVEAAVLNLCLNARDAMPEGGQLTITTFNTTLGERRHDDDPAPGQYVTIRIRDNGSGMTPDVRRRAFDPFFTTKGPGGSGLGLSQVYGVARQSGGTVRMESTPGVGTEVTLLFPRANAMEEPRKPDDTAPALPTPRAGDLILVVDDDHAVRQVTVEMLRDLGFEIVQAASGAEALGLLSGLPCPPRIVLLDYAMPEMNGLQLARRLRERGIDAPIALVTGYAELAEAATQSTPLDGLLHKPFTIRELLRLVTQLRAKSESRARREPAHAVGHA
jgi:signal transduction histidine kinase/CheY-like chemotaxis protein